MHDMVSNKRRLGTPRIVVVLNIFPPTDMMEFLFIYMGCCVGQTAISLANPGKNTVVSIFATLGIIPFPITDGAKHMDVGYGAVCCFAF